jgi:hypothetical protein
MSKKSVKYSVKKDLSGEFRKLRIYNLIMGFFHLAQGIVMLIISNSFSLPLFTSYLKFDIATSSLTSAPKEIGTLQIGPLVAIFLLLSALAHFLTVMPGIFPWYTRNLERKINYIRWWEYAFSSSLMIVVIAMLCGLYDLPSLIMIFTLNALMNFFGLSMEVHNQTTQRTNWTTFLFGCLAGIVPWIVICMYLFGALSSATTNIPTFVYFILGSIFIFFSIFAVNMVLQYKKVGPWKDYLYGERVYILLSLVAKTLLAWQIFAGTLRPV